ncbi:MAG: ribonuclease HII [Erysipelotrichales bacterium]
MSSLSKFDLEQQDYYKYIIGVDEVGRGCLAGPLVICAIIMKYDNIIDEINDSKQLSGKKRELLYDEILENAFAYEIIEIDTKTVDELNIYQATKYAMELAISKLPYEEATILIDAMPTKYDKAHSIVKGDAKSYAIACASIIAKVYRDRLMIDLALEYPEYDFENNKGYGTKKHIEALEKYGYIEGIHRYSFEPIKSMRNRQLTLF